jgi:hypothetical protein
MSTNSETNFLFAALFTYGYNPYEQDYAQLLADLCQGNHLVFLEICYELVKLIIPSLLLPASKLEDNVLETIANDLNKVLVPLWNLQIYAGLVSNILNAQNMASYAYGEKNKRSRGKYIKDCFGALDEVYKCLSEILGKNP